MLASFSTHRVDPWTVVAARGELDLASAPAWRRQLHEAVFGNDEPQLAVDLTGTDLFDSVSLGILLGVRRRVLERGGRCRLVIAADRIQRIFDLTGTAALFDIVRTVDDALLD